MYINDENITFKAVRAGGPGGQNADRRSTKVQIWVKVEDLPLSSEEKKLVRKTLAHHINKEDELWVKDAEERSQEINKERALEHLNAMLEGALTVQAPRIPTEPPRSAEDNRIMEKKLQSEKKHTRSEHFEEE